MVLMAGSANAEPLNLIFFGNSFTFGAGSTRSVDSLVGDLAVAAGHDRPYVVSAAVSGQDLEWHVNNNTSRIVTSIPPANDWDFIVMQEHSTKLTQTYTGSPAFPASIDESVANAVALHNVAKQRSPNVQPVLYETGARGPGFVFFTGSNEIYTGPDAMQTEIRAGYDVLHEALDDAAGADVTLLAPVGDAWQEANYDNLHSGDLWHAQNRGTLVAALVIYGTIYADYDTGAIATLPILDSLNLTADDGAFLTAAADATLLAENVPEPSTAAIVITSLLLGTTARRRRLSGSH